MGTEGLRSIQLSLTEEPQLMLSFLCSSRRQTGNLSSEGGGRRASIQMNKRVSKRMRE